MKVKPRQGGAESNFQRSQTIDSNYSHMQWNLSNLIDVFSDSKKSHVLSQGLHGLEKESLRCDPEGNLAITPHPAGLGDKLTNPHLTTDFSESQIEFITPPFETPQKTISFLEDLHRFAWKELKDELIWPLSMPCILPSEEQIPIAKYGNSPQGQKREIYRRGLALRYGKYMQTISGVHYNFSFHKDLWTELKNIFNTSLTQQELINEGYLHIVRNFIRYRWLLAYLFGASPHHHESYRCPMLDKDKENAVSLRLSRCGYSNPAKIEISYNTFPQHLNDLITAVSTPNPYYQKFGLEKDGLKIQLNDNILQIGDEYYFPIRLKPPKPYEDVIQELSKDGVRYIEVRIFDLNPFTSSGVTADQMYFCHLFLIFCLFKESPPIDEGELDEGMKNQQIVALKGRLSSLQIQKNNVEISLKSWASEILQEMLSIAPLLDKNKTSNDARYTSLVEFFLESLNNPENLPAFRMAKEMDTRNEDFLTYGLRIAKQNLFTHCSISS